MAETPKLPTVISIQLLYRLPKYLACLKEHREDLALSDHTMSRNISAPVIAKKLKLNEVQVRKDLAAVSSRSGKPRTGFDTDELIRDIESFLGYDNIDEAILVGVGNLGKALLQYKDYEGHGIKIIAAFDKSQDLIGTSIGGVTVLSVDKLEDFCSRSKIHIGILTVPENQAQEICDRMIDGGILAIWNFAAKQLETPNHILIRNENLLTSFVTLSKQLSIIRSGQDIQESRSKEEMPNGK